MPSVIDLYAGAGGLSLGAARAGFKVTAAVENDEYAIETHRRNFPNTLHLQNDITKLKGADLLDFAGLQKGELTGIIGGPPCQGFSDIGKRDADDNRNLLFGHFFRLVKETRPKFFFAENVPGILNSRYDKLRNDAFAFVKRHYELLPPITVTANEYGVPTSRKRIFFIGVDPDSFVDLDARLFSADESIEPTFVQEALRGLPEDISDSWVTEESGWQPIDRVGSGRYWELTTGRIPEGVGDASLIERYLVKKQVSGCMGTRHAKDVVKRFSVLLPGRRDKISKSVRLVADGFCPTLRAGTSRENGSYQALRPIHHKMPRVITPREAARLQGFPDWFVFHRTKWHSFRQIGNSVSPILAEYLLANIYSALKQ